MKKRIIIGTLLAVFLMMMLPTACAVESNTVKETMESQYPIIIPDIDFEELKEKYKDRPIEPTFFLIFILKQIIGLLRIIKFTAIFVVLLIIKRIFGNTTAIIS